MKKLILLVGVLVLIAGGAFIFLSGDAINALIKTKIEQVGSDVTEQSVTVNRVDMKLLKGAGTINGLVLANPSSYSAPSVFSLNEITLDINLKSLGTDLIVIDQIIIDKPEAVVEFTENGNANIKDLLEAIKKNTASDNTAVESESEQAEPIIRVNKFVLAGVSLTVDLTKLGNKSHQAILADIQLSNIGGESGMPASQLGAELVKQALSSIWQQAKAEQADILKEEAKDKIKEKAKEKLGGLLDKLNG
ncbi:AsmA family protein [Colwellia sp. 6_MG-2023]|uniref:DUF748 domain-containing protein n=1 Tax=Colwellia sp. 6_MG-2023 TaxID=3062676 RepID=UPI0026E2650C|nr:AsmA family protein [Colwellia sp. 6_MG-2023]MDO6489592.1 AsmA family protein [Colwellia sp. 6_MG-2023]